MSGKSILFICIMIPLIIYLLSKSDKNAKKSQKYCLDCVPTMLETNGVTETILRSRTVTTIQTIRIKKDGF